MSTSDYAFGVSNPGIDVVINKPYPGVVFTGTETLGGWGEHREINGSLWHVINASWVPAFSGFQQVNTALASYAFVITSSGFQYLTAAPGAAMPLVWSSAPASGFIFTSAVGLTAVGIGSGISNLSTPSGTPDPPLAPSGRDSFANTFVGYQAGTHNTLGYYNTAVGYQALYSQVGSDTTGFSNTCVGQSSMYANTTGSANTAIGEGTLIANTTGGNNTALGFSTLAFSTTASNNTAVGYVSQQFVTSGQQNTSIGVGALAGSATLSITGSQNVAVGYLALEYGGAGTGNTALGYESMVGPTTGITGNNNTGLGYGSLTAITSGSDNIGIGFNAGSNITTGNANVVIGYDSFAPSGVANYQLVIANFIYGGGMSGTGSTTSPGWVAFGAQTPLTTMAVSITGSLGMTNAAMGDGGGVQTAGANGPAVGGIGVGTPGTAFNGYLLEWGMNGSTNIGAFIGGGSSVVNGVTTTLGAFLQRGSSPSLGFDTDGNIAGGGIFPSVPAGTVPNTSPGFFTGSGVPSFNAMNGSMYLRSGGTAGGSTLWYYNASGASTAGTTWTALTLP